MKDEQDFSKYRREVRSSQGIEEPEGGQGPSRLTGNRMRYRSGLESVHKETMRGLGRCERAG